MTQRRVENDIDELSEEVLADLSRSDRLQLLLEAQARDSSAWATRLWETCPPEEYLAPDLVFTSYAWEANFEAMRALYNLETALLRFQLALDRWTDQALQQRLYDDEPLAAAEVSDRHLAIRFAECDIYYRAYDRFATEVLGVNLETWLAIHPAGPNVEALVADILACFPDLRAGAEAALDEALEQDDADGQRLDDWVDATYAQLADGWENV